MIVPPSPVGRWPVCRSTRTRRMPGGTRNGVAGWSASASFMKSRKIGAADGAAGFLAAEAARLVEADIDADGEIGREADEPGVLAVVGGAGLAGQRLADLP